MRPSDSGGQDSAGRVGRGGGVDAVVGRGLVDRWKVPASTRLTIKPPVRREPAGGLGSVGQQPRLLARVTLKPLGIGRAVWFFTRAEMLPVLKLDRDSRGAHAFCGCVRIRPMANIHVGGLVLLV